MDDHVNEPRKAQKPCRRHHYIPEFYLKRWTANNGKLVEFSKPHGTVVKPKRVSPRETGFQLKLYAMEGVPEEVADGFEREFFAPVDQRASEFLRKIEAGINIFNSAERSAWTQFMMTILFRNPEYVAAFKRRYVSMIQRTSKASERRWKRFRSAGQPATLRGAIKKAAAEDPGRIERAAMLTLMPSASSEKIGAHIVNMHWGSIELGNDAPHLLTSDRPVIWFGSLDHPQCHILMPIGPRRIFFAVNSAQEVRTIASQRAELVAQFSNETVTRRASKYVYATTDESLGYIQQTMGINPVRTIPDEILKRSLAVNGQRIGRRH